MTTQINVFKGTRSIIKWFQSMTISMTDGFCHSIDLSLNSLDLWDEFDPNINKGELTIKVLIGTTTYEFMCEERDVPIDPNGSTFSVWGRSRQARLDVPYARTVKDTEDTDHPWQTGDVSVSEIISYIISNYCDYPLTFYWNVEDFLVKEGTFSVDEQTPISIISSFADIIGAKLTAHPDGSLTVDYYSVEEETPVASYNDFDHIVSLNESNQYTEGYNAITVGGKNSDISPQIQHEVLEDDEEENNSWQVNVPRTVRVYYYHQDYGKENDKEKGISILTYPLSGVSVTVLDGNIETTTEDVLISWGSGSQSKFDLDGLSDVEGDVDVPLELRSVTYQTKYIDYSVRVSTEEETHLMFYFQDKTASTVLSVSIGEDSENNLCENLSLEAEVDGKDSTKFKLKFYGDISLVQTGYDLIGNIIQPPMINDYSFETVEEFIVFTEGKSNLSKTYFEGFYAAFPGESHTLSVTVGSTEIKAVDANKDMRVFGAFVHYITKYFKLNRTIPGIFLDNPERYTSYGIYFPTDCGGLLSASVSVPNLEEESNTAQSDAMSLVIENDLDGDEAVIRVYGNPDFVDKMYDMDETDITLSGDLETEIVEEKITFVEGEGTLSYPYYGGMVSDVPVETELYTTNVSIDYDEENDKKNKVVGVKYLTVFSKTRSIVSEYNKSDYSVFLEKEDGVSLSDSKSFDDTDEEDEESSCEEFIGVLRIDPEYEEDKGVDGIETKPNSTGVPSATQRIFHFQYNGDLSKIKRMYSSNGNQITMLSTGGTYEEFTERVDFTNGIGEIENAYYSGMNLVFINKPISPVPGYSIDQYSTEITLEEGPDYEDEFKYLFANATYKTYWLNGKVYISATEVGELTIYLETICGELLSVSTTIPDLFDADYKDIVLNIKDYTTEVNVSNVEVYVDNIYRGNTDGNGNINIHFIQVGDHSLRLSCDGYLDSDEDDLSNSTFTVE